MIKKNLSFALVLGLVVFFASCIDEFDPELTGGKERLVVESQITTKLQYQFVYLTFDAPFNSSQTNFKNLVRRAKVKVVDSDGNEYLFIDDPVPSTVVNTPEGFNYRSVEPFKVELGKSYQLFVETIDGRNVVSTLEAAVPVPKITKVNIAFQELPIFSDLKGQFQISVDVNDPAESKNFYKWDWYHVKQINFCREWYIFGSGGSVTQAFVDPCCEPCYQKETCVDCLELGNDRLINGRQIRNKFIANVPYNNTTNYYMVINQYSLSENAYRFWTAVKEQSKNSGGLFDATPKSIKGNLKDLNNESEEVLGYFTVSDVYEEIVNVGRSGLTIKPRIEEEYGDFWGKTTNCFPCQERFNRTKIAPKNWRN
jgi:hypothetical protein